MAAEGEILELIIIGAGIYGICAANTYLTLHPTANIKVLDSDSGVGGVWSRSRHYPLFWYGAETYHDTYDAKHITDYLENYVRDNKYDEEPLECRFLFNCWVRNVHKDDGEVWHVKAEMEGIGAVHFRSMKIIVATGAHSVPHMPKFSGRETFKGPVIHQKDLGNSKILTADEREPEKHRHITIIGGSKSASDIAYAAATDITQPRKVSWIIRISGQGPLLLSKAEGLGKYRSVSELGSIRAIASLSSANPYLPESWWTWLLHKTYIGEKLLHWVWSQNEIAANALADYDGRKGALDGFEGLKSDTSIR